MNSATSTRNTIDGPIIVYQMGKVGSRSIVDTLEGLSLGVPIYHRHVLENLDKMAEYMLKTFDNADASLKEIEEGKKLRRSIDEDPNQRWNIITLVRDPIAQHISSFFQSAVEYAEIIPNIRQKLEDGSLQTEDLIDIFLHKWLDYRPALEWFDLQFKPVFNLDVYKTPFPHEMGYSIINKGRFSVLLIRLENLDAFAEWVFNEFLRIPDILLIKTNSSNEKWYAERYRDFISKIVVPQEYIEQMYNSRFARHFYSESELMEFRTKWTLAPTERRIFIGLEKKSAKGELEKRQLKAHIRSLQQEIGRRDWDANSQVARITNLEKTIQRQESELGAFKSVLMEKNKYIKDLLNSYSWKVTLPLRAIAGLFIKKQESEIVSEETDNNS